MSDRLDDDLAGPEWMLREVTYWMRELKGMDVTEVRPKEVARFGLLIHLDRIATALEAIAEKLK